MSEISHAYKEAPNPHSQARSAAGNAALRYLLDVYGIDASALSRLDPHTKSEFFHNYGAFGTRLIRSDTPDSSEREGDSAFEGDPTVTLPLVIALNLYNTGVEEGHHPDKLEEHIERTYADAPPVVHGYALTALEHYRDVWQEEADGFERLARGSGAVAVGTSIENV